MPSKQVSDFPLKIGREIWTVSFRHIDEDGYVDEVERNIVINSRLREKGRIITLLHEILHVIGVSDEYESERLARCFWQILVGNGMWKSPWE